MDLNDIAKFRLVSQQIAGTRFKTPRELVGWMGAIQAQDYAMAKFAVGVRLVGSTDHDIEAAIDSGEILRTRDGARLAEAHGAAGLYGCVLRPVRP